MKLKGPEVQGRVDNHIVGGGIVLQYTIVSNDTHQQETKGLELERNILYCTGIAMILRKHW